MIETYFTDTFTRVRYSKSNIGKVIATDIQIYKGRFENKRSLLIGSNGEQVVSRARIFTSYSTDILEGDRIFLGSLPVQTGNNTGEITIPKTIQTYPVIRIEDLKKFSASHIEVMLG